MKTILLSLILCVCAAADPVRLVWDMPAADEPQVSQWRVYKINGGVQALIGSVEVPQFDCDLHPGETVAVTAYNGFESEPAILVLPNRPQAPKGLRVVRIETSQNLTDWKPLAFVPLNEADAPSQFIRAKIATITP